MKKALITLIFALGLLSLVGYGTARAYASNPDKYPSIIQKLVDKFGLNEDEVKAVFDEDRKGRQQGMQARFEEQKKEMETRFEEQLNQAVADGKINEEQKQAILIKKEEMQADREELKNLSAEEKEERVKAHQQEMETFAQEIGIDSELLSTFFGRGFGPGPRGRDLME